jgi:hypothetical protein
MTKQFVGLAGALGIFTATLYMTSAPTAGQASTVPALVITAYNGGPPPPDFAPPKTPWGEPDLQGVWSSDDATMGMQRQANFGDRLYLNDQEWAARQKTVQQGITNAENATSTFRNDFAVRAFRQTSLIVDPPNGQRPAILPEAQKRAAPRDRGTFGDGPFETPLDFTLYDRCITRGIVGSTLRVIYGNGNRIVQAPGVVAITYEMIHDTRVIYTDGRPHINNGIRQYLGSTRGHWDGDVLVAETTNLTDQTSIGLNGNGLRHSAQMKLTEKWKRVAGNVVQYQVTVDDPVTYARPFTLSMPLTPLSGDVILPYECHEGNLAIENSLSAERTEDRAIAADLAKGIKRERRPVQEPGRGGGGGRGGRGGAPAPVEGDQER